MPGLLASLVALGAADSPPGTTSLAPSQSGAAAGPGQSQATNAKPEGRSPKAEASPEIRKPKSEIADAELAAPRTPRDFYNLGTRQFQQGSLREAELSLQTAVASQRAKVQPLALYNLGHVRFQQGLQALMKAPDAAAAEARGRAACALADRAMQAADAALNSHDLDALVEAYIAGRGARKQLRAATEAVKRALDEHGAVLTRWRRASGDFKSAHELRADPDARHNAALVDRAIARLVDLEMTLKIAMQSCSQKRDGLQAKLGQMKKLIPKDMLQKCQNGEEDDEDEDEPPKEPKQGQQEAKPQEGRERLLSPEEAMRLLEEFKGDAHRKLPMGFEEARNPRDRDRTGRDW